MLTFTWNAPPHLAEARAQRSVVLLRLRPDDADEGTRVELTQLGWGDGGEWDEAHDYFDPAWDGVLRALQASPGIDQVTLAEKVALDTSTTADIATRLETKGWIVRELLPRRQRSLRLTAEGEAVLADMLPRVEPMYRALLAPMEAAEQAEFLRLLRKFVQLNEATPTPPNSGKPGV